MLKDEPADRITIACFTYMVRVMELRNFNRFFFGVIEGSDELSHRMTEESKKAFRDESAKYQTKVGHMSPCRQLISEVMLTRSVESFDLYVLQLLRLIFSVREDLVIEEEKLNGEVAKVNFANSDEYFLFLAERKIKRLSYKPLSELRKYIIAIIDIDLFETDVLYEKIYLATELRNLIAHNDCRVNDIFLKRTANLSTVLVVELGDRFAINEKFLNECIEALDHTVFCFDVIASARCKLPTMNRFTSFFFRGDFASSTV